MKHPLLSNPPGPEPVSVETGNPSEAVAQSWGGVAIDLRLTWDAVRRPGGLLHGLPAAIEPLRRGPWCFVTLGVWREGEAGGRAVLMLHGAAVTRGVDTVRGHAVLGGLPSDVEASAGTGLAWEAEEDGVAAVGRDAVLGEVRLAVERGTSSGSGVSAFPVQSAADEALALPHRLLRVGRRGRVLETAEVQRPAAWSEVSVRVKGLSVEVLAGALPVGQDPTDSVERVVVLGGGRVGVGAWLRHTLLGGGRLGGAVWGERGGLSEPSNQADRVTSGVVVAAAG